MTSPLFKRVTWLGFWAFCFVLTHLPPSGLPQVELFPHQDKVIHFSMYSILCWLSFQARPLPPRSRAQWLTGILILMLYSGFDELTQPLVGRTADWADILADWAGIMVGVMVVKSRVRLRPTN